MRIAALALLMMAALIQGPALKAGHDKCNLEQGPPCYMKSCAAMGKDGKPKGGVWCSLKCHKDCCFCAKSCNGHNPERQQQPSPDEE